jgi:murein DD-endopeptidase MepM/ murein hydrolase activator NlpD
MELKIAYPLQKIYPVTFKFGETPGWYLQQFGYPHNGTDIACPEGSPVYACDDGIVSFADSTPDSDGCGIFIRHSWGDSEYWHLSKLVATYMDHVKKGDLIGFSGHTGFASGPHLHFGIKVAGVVVENMRGWSDPELYFENGSPALAPIISPVKTYTVHAGDSLWKIALICYGNGVLWPQIFNANKSQITNPNIINPGQILIIP